MPRQRQASIKSTARSRQAPWRCSIVVAAGHAGPDSRRMRLKRGLTEYNLRIVVSGSGTLDPQAEIFKHRFSPIIVLTTGRASKSKLRELEKLADVVKICGDVEIDFDYALRWLRREWKVKRLLCEHERSVSATSFTEVAGATG